MSAPRAPISFVTTRWSLVHRAGSEDQVEARAALGALCEAYWYPTYAYIRRLGKSPHEAEDLTQGFFLRLVAKDTLSFADPTKGKLRTFLLACVRHFLADEYDREQARKRGPGLLISFDVSRAEERYAAEPIDHLSPDRLFQRQWALALLEETLRMLGEEFAAEGKAPIFRALRPFLGFGTGAVKSYETLATELGVSVGTLKNLVFRLRERWRELLLEQVASTLKDPTPEEIRGELSELLDYI